LQPLLQYFEIEVGFGIREPEGGNARRESRGTA
jgi:hypothetical protein